MHIHDKYSPKRLTFLPQKQSGNLATDENKANDNSVHDNNRQVTHFDKDK